MNLNRDIVPIWWVWLHDLDIPWHQRNHFKVRLATNHERVEQKSPPARPFLIQFSQILLGKLFIDSDLISPWLSGLLTLGNLLNTWLSPVSTLSSQQTRHGHQRWYLVTILWQSCYGSLESVSLLNTTLAPHDTMRDIRDTVMSCVTRHRDGWLNNMRCLFKILSASSPKSIGRDRLDFIHFQLGYVFFMIFHYGST